VLGATVVARGSGPQSEHDEPYCPSDHFLLPPAELAATERAALDGSADDALRLYFHHEFRAVDSYGGVESLFWLTVAAENGSVNAQYLLGRTLLGNSDPKLRRRARFWLRRAADAGLAHAKELLSTPGPEDATTPATQRQE
jgi:TPR repeat protein